ncbi:MAG TPA: hypothetical protein VD903_12235 [Pseudonocardia sp.]|nr:hypothetical protein [Pseudonocardia sp.]
MPFLQVTSPSPATPAAIADLAATLARELGLPPDAVVAQWITTTGTGGGTGTAEVRGTTRGRDATSRALAALARRLAETTGAPPGHVLATWPTTEPGRSITGTGTDLHPAEPATHPGGTA